MPNDKFESYMEETCSNRKETQYVMKKKQQGMGFLPYSLKRILARKERAVYVSKLPLQEVS